MEYKNKEDYENENIRINIRETYNESLLMLGNISENIGMILLSALMFFLPFFINHPQIIVGSIVNAAIIIGATYLRGYKLLPIIIMPSIGVVTAGILFGSYTIYLLYLMPLIWIANAAYAYIYKFIIIRQQEIYKTASFSQKVGNRDILWHQSTLSIIISSATKAALMSVTVLLLVKLSVIPEALLAPMGIFQLFTALIGGTAAIIIISLQKRFLPKIHY